ncbi:ribosomal RNA small subunit methyltransferase A [Candidatus Saccharibacteria bacterium CG_4_10_14_0_2_um_filter_52_9]|nr:MAG: ribosomal RNA small subunit methyltransferase A [Candidatus Saccharibacteria bacterium CG_4_10_14_0_2_um_filter_52_9]
MANSPPPKKSLGQHWLYDEASLQAMCQAAAVQPNDTVLEIGSGLGTLTELLIKQSKQVVAVEFDENLAASLPNRVRADNLEVITQDILSFDLTKLPLGYKLVANIPYYLTSNLIRVISETANPPTDAAILVQKEVAQRVAAAPGDMSLLSVTAQFYWQVSLGREVKAELFTPPPKVDSQILILKKLPKPLFPDVDPKDFFRLVKAGFAQRRKTLLNSLSAGLWLDKEVVKTVCGSVDINPTRRAQTLSLEEWHNLYQSLQAVQVQIHRGRF